MRGREEEGGRDEGEGGAGQGATSFWAVKTHFT